MSCPTCDHTMRRIGETCGDPVFWCPRCGTIRAQWTSSLGHPRPDQDDPPALVARCREFEEELNRDSRTVVGLRAAHTRLGIREAIRPEGER